MDTKTILVTGIGGNVGQGILRNIKNLDFSIKLIGCDISSFTAGNHLCDKTYQVPYAYEENYLTEISKIVKEQKVDMIIPSTDYEIYYLGLCKGKLDTFILASDPEISKQFLDKYLTWKLFDKHDIPFAKSWLPKEYDNSEKEVIAKPRKGRGSRGIIINPKNISRLGDDYMIQKLYNGKEVTTAVYVNKKQEIHGVCSMERTLENGTTSKIILNNSYDDKLKEIAEEIVKLKGVIGSFNIQSIIDSTSQVYPFEINCRISGTNSIRHNLGFQDVKYAVQEYLYDISPDDVNIKNPKAVAIRILMDIIYPEATSFEDLNDNSFKHFIY
ncbi:ATP-grasp domain-containing protein [Aquimarina rubra]|uniref:ATP-grasp domain-containing protein n=1 Tax=Aquimarina rubra TaxID=1920033 RepID=A0ABW5LL18_9FLAO